MTLRPIVLIPARMASTRLPGKPLADIGGRPMIVRVLEKALEAGFRRVAVACAEDEIAAAVRAAGGEAVLTDPDHPSGSDRIAEALARLDPQGAFDAVVNLQGDLPTLEPQAIRDVAAALESSGADIATLAAPCADEETLPCASSCPNSTIATLAVAPPGGICPGVAIHHTATATTNATTSSTSKKRTGMTSVPMLIFACKILRPTASWSTCAAWPTWATLTSPPRLAS